MIKIVQIPLSRALSPAEEIRMSDERFAHQVKAEFRHYHEDMCAEMDALLADGYVAMGAPVLNPDSPYNFLVWTLHKP
ncbi:MAG: hypothetical protein SF123_09720 [Chloroflexota bacterium]|nr:hypothetical protein [Chloroflexota bacterium]